MIISASRRTDLPAFYADWLAARLRAGSCTVHNPFNPRQRSCVSLLPEDVEAIVFWTRDARPLFDQLDGLERRGYRFYFQYTVTAYGPPLEPRAPPPDLAVATCRTLAARLRPGSVVWRYDPILLGPAFPAAWHREQFGRLARALEGACRRVVVSPLVRYRKTDRRVGALYRFGHDLAEEVTGEPSLPGLLAGLRAIADERGLEIEACAVDWSAHGIPPTRCVDDRLLATLFGGTWPNATDRGQRPGCRCLPSKDIGATDTCRFGCAYCYATVSDAAAARRAARHDPEAPSLVPQPPPGRGATDG